MLQLSPPLSTVNNAEHVYKCWFKYPFSILLGIYIPRGRTVGTSHDSVFNVSMFSAASTASFKRPKRKKKSLPKLTLCPQGVTSITENLGLSARLLPALSLPAS